MVEDSAQLVRVAAKAARLHHLFEMEARRRLEPLTMETHNADTHTHTYEALHQLREHAS